MPAKVIAELLRADTVDRTAQDVINANPAGTFVNGVSSVPEYLYLSLKSIWTSPSALASEYTKLVVPNLGTGQSSSLGSIVVVPQNLNESVTQRKSVRSDQPGAEVCPLYFLLYKPRATSLSITPIQSASLRIQYLIDNTVRGATRGVSGSIPANFVAQSNSLDARFQMFCFFERTSEPVLASEATLIYRADYVRMFAR